MFAATWLARAEQVDPTRGNLTTVLTCAGIVLGVGFVALIPVIIAWSRRHQRADWVITLAILWGVLTTVSVASAVLAEMKYSDEHTMAIQSGYFDPNDTSDAPPLPISTWAALGVGYLALLAWPLIRRTKSVEAEIGSARLPPSRLDDSAVAANGEERPRGAKRRLRLRRRRDVPPKHPE